MIRTLVALVFLVCLAPLAGFADVITFSGSGSSGTIDPGQPFFYNFDGNNDWGVPGINNGLATWNSSLPINSFTIMFDLPGGVTIDANDLGTNCNGGPSSGTVFCAAPYTQPWSVTSLTGNSITFTAQNGGDILTNGDQFFINIFFTGDATGSSFSGEWESSVPEPGSFLLFGSGLVAVAGVLRRRRLW